MSRGKFIAKVRTVHSRTAKVYEAGDPAVFDPKTMSEGEQKWLAANFDAVGSAKAEPAAKGGNKAAKGANKGGKGADSDTESDEE